LDESVAEPESGNLTLRGRIIAVVVGAVFVLAVGEMAVRLLGYQAMYDTYSKPSIFWIHDPLVGWSHEPHARGNYIGPRPWPVEFEGKVNINSMGLRGPELSEVPDGGYRILVLGDSYVAGFEVDDDQTFSAALERQLTEELGVPVQVVNAGVRGYGTDQELLYYRERGRKLKPDLVILSIAFNDFRNNTMIHRMRRPFGKAAFAIRDDVSLELIGSPVPKYPLCSAYRLTSESEIEEISGAKTRATCWMQMKAFDHSALFTVATLVLREMPMLVESLYRAGDIANERDEQIKQDQEAVKLTKLLISEIAAIAAEDGSAFFMSGYKNVSDHLEFDRISSGEIEYLESDAVFITENVYLHDLHLNPLGHERFAALLAPTAAKYLRNRKH
jgi:lysophospholipase L1-like esterase